MLPWASFNGRNDEKMGILLVPAIASLGFVWERIRDLDHSLEGT
jgi:hypothetical protein